MRNPEVVVKTTVTPQTKIQFWCENWGTDPISIEKLFRLLNAASIGESRSFPLFTRKGESFEFAVNIGRD